jgi:hypothetical protein
MQSFGPEIAEHRAKGARNKHREPECRLRVERAHREAEGLRGTLRPCPF